MQTGKLIVIEGTDCSGKETQSKRLIEHLKQDGIECIYFGFPQYDTPTGKIVGGPYLGKDYICHGWFPEGAVNVSAEVASLYYAADRKYNIERVLKLLEEGKNVILDRYVYSNMAHQGGKIKDAQKRHNMYKWLETLEFDLLALPIPDIKIFLHLSYEASKPLKAGREEALDEHERNQEHLLQAEQAYIEIANEYGFKTIECDKDNQVLSKDEIHTMIYEFVKGKLSRQKSL